MGERSQSSYCATPSYIAIADREYPLPRMHLKRRIRELLLAKSQVSNRFGTLRHIVKAFWSRNARKTVDLVIQRYHLTGTLILFEPVHTVFEFMMGIKHLHSVSLGKFVEI